MHTLKKTYDDTGKPLLPGQPATYTAVCICLHKEKAGSLDLAISRLKDHCQHPNRAAGRG